MLSTRKGREAYVEPVVEAPPLSVCGEDRQAGGRWCGSGRYQAVVPVQFRCLLSGDPITYEYIDDEANAGRMKERLMAVVLAGDRARIYLSPTPEAEAVARSAEPVWKPDTPSRGTWAGNAQGRRYGFETFGDYFTPRQLVALTTFSDLVAEAIAHVRRDAICAGLPDDGKPLRDGGNRIDRVRGSGRCLPGVCVVQTGRPRIDDLHVVGREGIHPEHLCSSGHSDDVGLRGTQPDAERDRRLSGGDPVDRRQHCRSHGEHRPNRHPSASHPGDRRAQRRARFRKPRVTRFPPFRPMRLGRY